MLEIVFTRLVGAAASQAEFIAHQVERRSERARVRKWAEVTRAVVLAHPRQLKTGNQIAHVDLDQQVRLVVAERDVVARSVFLDEPAFEQQRLRFGFDNVVLEIPDALDESASFHVGSLPARRHEVAADAFAQVSRLADVDDAVQAVAHQVNARLVRHVAQFLGEIGFGLG